MDSENYNDILLEIQRTLKQLRGEGTLREQYQEKIFKHIFLNKMGYLNKISPSENNNKEIIVESKLRIKMILKPDVKKDINEMSNFQEAEWGILLSPYGLWLINTEVKRGDSIFSSSKIILEIVFGKNTDQKYFKYFSYDNILGKNPNANFYRDIILYKNTEYKGKQKSWGAYHSTLKRFFNFYASNRCDFRSNIYEKISLNDLEEYLKLQTKAQTPNSIKSAFFYLKNFMDTMAHNRAFDISSTEFLKKFDTIENESQDIMNIEKLKIAAQYLEKQRNSVRNVPLFFMLLTFGVERRKLCLLEWKKFDLEKGTFILDGREYVMPRKLQAALDKLKAENISTKYVFYNSKKNSDCPMKEGAVNDVLSKIVQVDEKDVFYRYLTPANIRRCLVKYLLKSGCPLERVIYLANIDICNLGSYISKEDIDKINREKYNYNKEGEVEKRHPMEGFLEQL